MNAKEVVRALRCCSNVDTRKPDCENCPLFSTRLCVKTMLEGAADLIESLQAQLFEYDAFAAEYGIDGKTMLTLAKSQIRTAQDNVKLQEQLADSQRRERAAVEAINRMAEYIVTYGRVDYYLCDDIPKELHLKYQPKNDGNYQNSPCAKCVAEYFMCGADAEIAFEGRE